MQSAQSAAARKTRALAANAARFHGSDSIQAREASRDHRAQVLEEHIAEVLASVPPLTSEQVAKLRDLLGGA